MANSNRWKFSEEQLANTPSRKHGVSESAEMALRQEAAYFIYEVGKRIKVSLLTIINAVTYMHRFYMFHSFMDIHKLKLSLSALFLAAKAENQCCPMEYLIMIARAYLYKDSQRLDVRSDLYEMKMWELVNHEEILLMTLGFEVFVEHPHVVVIKILEMMKANKELSKAAYIIATSSLLLTTMCLEHKAGVVASVSIYLACKLLNYKIDPCSKGKDWFYYVDSCITTELLDNLANKFIGVIEMRKKYLKEMSEKAQLSRIRNKAQSSFVKNYSRGV